jgi:peptidyl-prolyl cis-trans isomerase D
MLDVLRRHSRSWITTLIIGMIALVFVFWGMGGFNSARTQAVASVNGANITLIDFDRLYRKVLSEYQEKYQGELTDEMLKVLHLKEQVLNHMIDQALLLKSAQDMGLSVSDAELREHIRNYPPFQDEQGFNRRRYLLVLRHNHLSPAEFEEQERQNLLRNKVRQTVTAFAKVSEGDLKEVFQMAREALEVNYLVIDPAQVAKRPLPPEAQLSAYYQEHKEEFRHPAGPRVQFLLFRPENFLNRVQITDAEVADFLKDNGDQLVRPKVIQARQIFLNLSPKAKPAERQKVEKQARDLLRRARSGEDFAPLAQKFSQDAAVKEKGALSDVKPGQQPPAWEKTAFALRPGETGMVSTDKGVYLIKVENWKETEKMGDKEAKAEAANRLKGEKAARLAQDAAHQAHAQLAGASVEEVAQKTGGIAVDPTSPAASRDLPELFRDRRLLEFSQNLKPKEISQVIDLPQGFVIVKRPEEKTPGLPSLEQVKGKVAAGLEATQILARLKKGEPRAQVAAQAGVPLSSSGFFTRSQGFLGQPLAQDLTGAAFQLSAQEPYPPRPLLWKDKYYVMIFKERRSPSPQEFDKEKDKLLKAQLEMKRQRVFEQWLAGQRQTAKIELYEMPY